MNTNLKHLKQIYCTLVAVFFSLCMFSNNSEGIYFEKGAVVSGFENVHVTQPSSSVADTIYVTEETLFYSLGTLFAKVVFPSTLAEIPKHQKQLILQQYDQNNSTIAPQPELTQSPLYPLSGVIRNTALFATASISIVPFSGKNAQKNAKIYPIISRIGQKNGTLFFDVLIKTNSIYICCTLRHSSHADTALFGRPPPTLVTNL